MGGLLIGDVAERTGLSAPTIRHYESIGLLPRPSRSAAGYRHYTDATVAELRLITKAQALGFSLDEIGEILKLSRAGRASCSHVLDRQASPVNGLLLAMAFGVGRGLPFLLVGLFAGALVRFTRVGYWRRAIQAASGTALLVVSLYYTRAFITLA